MTREKRHWGLFPQQLEEGLGQGTKVLALDLPGFGSEADFNSPSTISEIVNFVRGRWLKQRKENEEWGILAVSLGGMVTLSWISKFPQDFKRAVVINSSVSGLSPIFKRVMPQNIGTFLKIALSPDFVRRERAVLEMTTNLRGKELDELTAKHVEYLKEVNPLTRNVLAQLRAILKFQPPAIISTPLLVLSSLGDSLVDPSCSEVIAKFYHSPLRVHSAGNHDLTTDDGPWVVQEVKNWLSQ